MERPFGLSILLLQGDRREPFSMQIPGGHLLSAGLNGSNSIMHSGPVTVSSGQLPPFLPDTSIFSRLVIQYPYLFRFEVDL